jgi:hypothetical protein
MRVLGRLAVAVAVVAPVFAVGTAGAASQYSTLCGAGNALPGTNVGSINSVLVNNGVAGPGLLLAKRNPQQLRLAVPGNACVAGPVGQQVVTRANVTMQATTATAVNCGDLLKGAQLGGNGKFTWTAPAGMGTSSFAVRWVWKTDSTIHFWGSVSNTGSSNNIFSGDRVSGFVLTKERIISKASGGDCTATIALTHWTVRQIAFTVQP